MIPPNHNNTSSASIKKKKVGMKIAKKGKKMYRVT